MKSLYKIFSFSLLIFFLATLQTYSQEKINATFQAGEGKVFIYYELKGDPAKEYDVSVVLKRSSDPSFELVPSVLVGDVGKGKFAGGKKTIIWQLNPQEEEQLNGEDFYFEVTANEIESSGGGGIPWYVYAGGAALAGGAAAFFLLKKSNDNTSTTSADLPRPPARP